MKRTFRSVLAAAGLFSLAACSPPVPRPEAPATPLPETIHPATPPPTPAVQLGDAPRLKEEPR